MYLLNSFLKYAPAATANVPKIIECLIKKFQRLLVV